MSVKEELDLTQRIKMWTIYDNMENEVCKIIMEDGILTFYFTKDREE